MIPKTKHRLLMAFRCSGIAMIVLGAAFVFEGTNMGYGVVLMCCGLSAL